jgi:hypothetical protein
MVIDIIRAHAVLNQFQRSDIEIGGYTCIAAKEADFQYAANLYSVLSGICGGQATKLTRKESEIIQCIIKLGVTEFTVSDLQKISGFSNSVIHKIIQGYVTRGSDHSGLLEKCPAISFYDRSRTVGDQIESISKRSRAFSWDQDAYNRWIGNTHIWLDPDQGLESDEDYLRRCGNLRQLAAENRNISEGFTDIPEETNLDPKSLIFVAANSESIEENTSQYSDEISRASVILNAATSEKISEQTGENPGNAETASNMAAVFAATSPQPAATSENISESGAGLQAKRETVSSPPAATRRRKLEPGPLYNPDLEIEPKDFKKLDLPILGPCDRCLSRNVSYIEKATRTRQAREVKTAYRVCEKCYNAEKKRIAGAVRSLPGVVNIAGMARIYSDVGKCHICNTLKATWRDPVQHLIICDSCYTNAGGRLEKGSEA